MISNGDNHPHDLESRFLTANIIIILTIFIIIITITNHHCPEVLDYPIRYELLRPECGPSPSFSHSKHCSKTLRMQVALKLQIAGALKLLQDTQVH